MDDNHTGDWMFHYPVEYPQLRLTYGNLNMAMIVEELIEYKRVTTSQKEVARSYSGHTIIADTCHRDFFSWTLNLSLGVFQSDILRSIDYCSNKARKTPPRTGWEIQLGDIAQPVIEDDISRTKAVSWEYNTPGGLKKYFAVFNVLINSIEFNPNGRGYNVALELTEV